MIYCFKCGAQIPYNSLACGCCGTPVARQSGLTCPRCKGHNVLIHPVTNIKTERRGCFGWALWILLAIVTCGLILIIPLITNSKTKSKTHTEAVCQSCGKRWRV